MSPSASDAARGVGGCLALGWVVIGALTIIALKRVTRLASAPPILYAYAPAKFFVLLNLLLWSVTEVFIELWWADPRAIPWRSIAAHTIVEGLCRPVVFGAIIVHWRTPLSNYVVRAVEVSAPSGDIDAMREPSSVHAAVDDGDVTEMQPPPPPRVSAYAPVHTATPAPSLSPPRPGPSRAIPGAGLVPSHHGRQATAFDGVRYARSASRDHDDGPRGDAEDEGGEDPSSNSDPTMQAATTDGAARNPSVAFAMPVDDDVLVQRRLRRLVVSRTRAVLAVLVIVVWFVMHVAAAVLQAQQTESVGGLQWCGSSRDFGTNMCVVPIDGSSTVYARNATTSNDTATGCDTTLAPTSWPPLSAPPTTNAAAPPSSSSLPPPRGNVTNASSWLAANATATAPVSTTWTAASTVAPCATSSKPAVVYVTSNFTEVPLHVVPSQVLEFGAFVQMALIAVFWYITGQTQRRGLLSRVAIRGFTPFFVVTTCALLFGTIVTLPLVFLEVRSQGRTYSAFLLLREAADVIVVTAVAWRAFRQRYVDASAAVIGGR